MKPRSQIAWSLTPAALSLVCVGLVGAHPQQAQRVHHPRYTLVEIPSLHPTGHAYAGGLNQLGDVCGTSMAPNGMSEHAFLFADGVITDAHTFWNTYSWGDDVTDDRAVHGYSNVSVTTLHAFRWQAGSATDIHGGPHQYSRALCTNRHGDHGGMVNGFFNDWVTRYRGYVDFGDPAITIIDTFGGNESRAEDLNDRRQAVGMARALNGESRAFLWEQDTLTDLGDLGGGAAWARAINDAGALIVGRSKVPSGDFHAFVHDTSGMHDLGTLGGLASDARDVNHLGHIVGAADRAAGTQRATLWIDGHAIDLDTLASPGPAWVLTGAHSINDLGQIAGTGQHNGTQRPYRLDPITTRPRHTPALPSRSGFTATTYARGVTPGVPVELWASLILGTSTSPCGATLRLSNPILASATLSDAEGRCAFVLPIPPTYQGMTVHTQIVDPSTCKTSRVVTQLVE
jgi:probable HAF family extracellular repeat protein